MSNHYRFTETMIFKVNTDKKTIHISGSYKYEDLEESKRTALLWYPDYILLDDNCICEPIDLQPFGQCQCNYHTSNEDRTD